MPGLVAVNDTPPGEVGSRLLVLKLASSPLIFKLCDKLVNDLGGEKYASKAKLCDPVVSTVADTFLRTVHYAPADGERATYTSTKMAAPS